MTLTAKILSAASMMLTTTPAISWGHEAVSVAARDVFPRMPEVRTLPQIAGVCGADLRVSPDVAYCTSENVILLVDADRTGGRKNYLLAHAYGHAVQVQHGVADVALREITRRPDDETRLRGYVERQVDCIAGFLLSQAGKDLPDLTVLFESDPLDLPHWGRNPLRAGPHLEVPLTERTFWLAIGYEHGLEACEVGEFTAELLVAARRR